LRHSVQYLQSVTSVNPIQFLVRDAFVSTNCRTIAVTLTRLSILQGWVCIVITQCILGQILVYGSSPSPSVLGTLTPKHVHLLSAIFFQFHMEEKWGLDVQTMRDVSRTVEDRG